MCHQLLKKTNVIVPIPNDSSVCYCVEFVLPICYINYLVRSVAKVNGISGSKVTVTAIMLVCPIQQVRTCATLWISLLPRRVQSYPPSIPTNFSDVDIPDAELLVAYSHPSIASNHGRLDTEGCAQTLHATPPTFISPLMRTVSASQQVANRACLPTLAAQRA
ncbi:hypothetical protein RRG08_039818 [Elysia crispata]|uniref:Uncharacterized protein n=1 Tax=Elysia crispata TaxID=231223 RepID=A0AAE1AN89_9GAST|nr:hypothetical protein RRG08_039818 [Elysia crispata]